MCELRSDEHVLLDLPTLTDPHRWDFEGNEVEYPGVLGSLGALGTEHRLHGFWQYTKSGVDLAGAHTTGNLQMLVSARKASHGSNVVEDNAKGVGGWGGTCTCPDGQG